MGDIFKGTMTGYYDEGVIVDDRKKIVKRYLRKGLPYDLLTYLAVLVNRIIFPNINVYVCYFVNLLMFFKLKLIFEIINKLDMILLMK